MNEFAVTVWANGFRSPLTDVVYYAFEPDWATLYVVSIGLALASRRHDYRALFTFGATVALTWVPVVVLKVVAHRPRPSGALLPHPVATPPGDWSFPSGHVAFATALAVAVFLFTRSRWARGASAALVPVMGATVLVTGVHYPSDVLFSVAWSLLLGPVWFRLVCRAGSLLPAPSGSGRAPVSGAGSARTCPPSIPNPGARTPQTAAVRG